MSASKVKKTISLSQSNLIKFKALRLVKYPEHVSKKFASHISNEIVIELSETKVSIF